MRCPEAARKRLLHLEELLLQDRLLPLSALQHMPHLGTFEQLQKERLIDLLALQGVLETKVVNYGSFIMMLMNIIYIYIQFKYQLFQ